MKVQLYTPRKVSVASLARGDFFVKEFKDGRLSSVYQKITQPQNLGKHSGNSDEVKKLSGLVYYIEVWCGWQYSYTKEEAENKMVYKVVPINGALEVKLDLDITR